MTRSRPKAAEQHRRAGVVGVQLTAQDPDESAQAQCRRHLEGMDAHPIGLGDPVDGDPGPPSWDEVRRRTVTWSGAMAAATMLGTAIEAGDSTTQLRIVLEPGARRSVEHRHEEADARPDVLDGEAVAQGAHVVVEQDGHAVDGAREGWAHCASEGSARCTVWMPPARRGARRRADRRRCCPMTTIR